MLLISPQMSLFPRKNREADRLPGETPTPPAGMERPVSLAALSRSSVQVDWYDAIAIAQGICRVILDAGDGEGPAELDGRAVFIDAAGRVGITSRGERSDAKAVQQVCTIMAQLLPEHDPMSVRDRLVAGATSTPPAYASLGELSRALEYFERPRRDDLIRSLHNRWQNRLTPATRILGTPLAPAVGPHAGPGEAGPARFGAITGANVARLAGVAAVALLLASGIGAWLMVRRAHSPASTSDVSDTAQVTSQPKPPPARIVKPRATKQPRIAGLQTSQPCPCRCGAKDEARSDAPIISPGLRE